MYTNKTVCSLSQASLLVIGLAIYVTPQSASGVTPDGSETGGVVTRPGNITPTLPEPGILPIAPIEIEPPKVFEKKKRLAYGKKFFVKEIKVSGSTVFNVETLKKITAQYENRIIYNSELEDVRIALTRKYIDSGYINSGATLPNQKVVDGIVHIQIIEGQLKEIEILGNKALNSSYIEERLKLGANTPLNVNELQEQIQIMLKSPIFSSIKSALRPGDQLGDANLTALIKEGPRVVFTPSIDNRISPTLGDIRVRLPLKINNLTGYGDTFSASYGHSKGLQDSNYNWTVPLNAHDTSFSIFVAESESKVVQGSFTPLNVESSAKNMGVRISHPFYRTSKTKFNMSLGLDVRNSQSRLLGQGYAFTAGVPADGKVNVTVIRFSQDGTKRSANKVIAARSLFSMGIDKNGATINENNTPSGEFLSWLGQFQWVKLLDKGLGQIIFRTSAQITNDSLFAMEQYSLGGALSVRGYSENEIVRDSGYNLSVEYRYPLIKDGNGRNVLTFTPFIDAGGSNNITQPDGSAPKFISSVGFGFRWDPTKKVHAEVYWGHANDKTDNSGSSLQDKGIHFLMNANVAEW